MQELSPIVDLIDYLRPGEMPGSLEVGFKNGKSANLASDDGAFELRKMVLHAQHRYGLPVYVGVEEPKDEIKEFHIPLQGMVTFQLSDQSGLHFLLDNSAKAFLIGTRNPNYKHFSEVLHTAQLAGQPVRVTEAANGRDVLDLQAPGKGEDFLATLPEVVTIQPATSIDSEIPDAFRPISETRAQELFEMLQSFSCPVSPEVLFPWSPFPAIPFLYPENGCHARAHAMCRLLIELGESPLKVWNFCNDIKKLLLVKTPNSPKCQVKWCVHVAPVLHVKIGRNTAEKQVFDPSLFPKPVSVPEWKDEQNRPESCLVFSTGAPYIPPQLRQNVIYDADCRKTLQDLVQWTCKLASSVHKFGPPPYRCGSRTAS